jgi:deoxyribose-phosphate aldolase
MPEAPLPAWLVPHAGTHGLARFIDHTLLKPEATRAQVLALCEEALRYEVRAVCVNGAWAEACADRLAGRGVALAVVVGFPLGAMAAAAKAEEARMAVAAGASEIDMVAPLGEIKAGEWVAVERDVRSVVEASGAALVKVIVESAALDSVEIVAACRAAVAAGAGFVKTSTGFHPAGGATEQAVALMRRTVGPGIGVKASGGIRTAEAAVAMLAAGADRIGTSAPAAMAAWLGPSAPTLEALMQTRPGPATPQAPVRSA